MKKLKNFLGRFAGAFSEGVISGTFVGVVLFYAYLLVYILFTDDQTAVVIALVMLALNVVGVFTAVFIRLHKNFHTHDQEIIGKNFVGVSRKCRIFSEALDDLFARRLPKALQGFKSLETDYSDLLADQEPAIVAFYIGRCYDIMNYSPNALRYYEQAKMLGFSDKVLPFLTARCTGANGDTGEALELYRQVLSDRESPFRHYVRTDVGRMYIRRDEPEEAMKWYSEAMTKHQNYAEALGGAAIAKLLLHEFGEAEKLYRSAILNHIGDPVNFTAYYKEVRETALSQAKE